MRGWFRRSERREGAAPPATPGRQPRAIPACDAYVEEYLEDYARRNKASSLHTQTSRLRRFRDDFKGRSLDLSRSELKQWMYGEGAWSEQGPVPRSHVQAVIGLYNHAIDEGEVPLAKSPARKLTSRYPGRAGQAPPSPEEFEELVAACSALGDYAPRMRALVLFAAYTLMRPGELFALEWSDIDFPEMRINKARRLDHGILAEPKTGAKRIALPQPALEAIKWLSRDSELVFTSKHGCRLTARALSDYWGEVQRAANLRFDFYHATKHYGVHYMWTKMGLSPRAIAAQAGWKLETATRMLAVYGHAEVGALEELDDAYSRSLGFPGREVVERLERWEPRRDRTVPETQMGEGDWRGHPPQRWGS